MRHLRNAAIALMAIGGAALIGSAANAQSYGYGGPRSGSYYGYATDQADHQNSGRAYQTYDRN